jgi:hypothetical protein
MTLRIFPIFLDKNGKICPSMQCQTNFSSFLKIEKFCPSVGQRMLRQSSGVLSPLSLCRAMMTRRESVYFFSKFFKTLLKNFAPCRHRRKIPYFILKYLFLISLDTDPHLASVVFVPLSLFRFEIRVVCVWELVYVCACEHKFGVATNHGKF